MTEAQRRQNQYELSVQRLAALQSSLNTMVCPACVIPAGAVAASAGAALGLPRESLAVQGGVPAATGLACFAAIRYKNGAWRLGCCRNSKMAAVVGASLLAMAVYTTATTTSTSSIE